MHGKIAIVSLDGENENENQPIGAQLPMHHALQLKTDILLALTAPVLRIYIICGSTGLLVLCAPGRSRQ
jgi:hypothetical protein